MKYLKLQDAETKSLEKSGEMQKMLRAGINLEVISCGLRMKNPKRPAAGHDLWTYYHNYGLTYGIQLLSQHTPRPV
jgi:hypothetical protein